MQSGLVGGGGPPALYELPPAFAPTGLNSDAGAAK
jgi:hypothetical protein